MDKTLTYIPQAHMFPSLATKVAQRRSSGIATRRGTHQGIAADSPHTGWLCRALMLLTTRIKNWDNDVCIRLDGTCAAQPPHR
jgi:hypothetical protein